MGVHACRHKSDTEAKREKLVARYLQPLVKIPASTTTADADVQRYHYRLLKHQLAPKLQPQAKGCAIPLCNVLCSLTGFARPCCSADLGR